MRAFHPNILANEKHWDEQIESTSLRQNSTGMVTVVTATAAMGQRGWTV
jgi:hypothetical protein